jgi:hypothetical protein
LVVVVVDKDVAVAGRVDIALDDSPRSLYDLGNLGVSDVPSLSVHTPFFAFELRRSPVKRQSGLKQPGWAISKDRP